ncbi:hypothetical protein HOE22_12005 [Candidatus Woesearchaeota archaeon]|nr:hypothetical protein [Candidatus Woesearchaeota archaeon]
MRIAISLSGYVGWVNGSYNPNKGVDSKKSNIDNLVEVNPKLSYFSIMEKIVEPNDYNVDFFIHTWNDNRKDELNKLYQPKSIVAEPQDPFDKGELDDFGIKYRNGMRHNNRFRCYSKFNATYKVLKLVREYELKNDFKYDVVLTTRLDVIYNSVLNFSDYDLNKLWIGDWHIRGGVSTKERFNDIIYFSNSDIMNGYVTEYKNINKFSQDNPYRNDLPTDPHYLFRLYSEAITKNIEMFWVQDKNKDYEIVRLST